MQFCNLFKPVLTLFSLSIYLLLLKFSSSSKTIWILSLFSFKVSSLELLISILFWIDSMSTPALYSLLRISLYLSIFWSSESFSNVLITDWTSYIDASIFVIFEFISLISFFEVWALLINLQVGNLSPQGTWSKILISSFLLFFWVINKDFLFL